MSDADITDAINQAIAIERDSIRDKLLPTEHADANTRTVNTRYTDEFKMLAAVYYQMGLSYGVIAEKLGIAKSTVHEWVFAFKQDLTARKAVEHITESLPSKANLVASRLLSSVTDEKIEQAGLRDTVQAAKMAHEIARLADNKSTSNISVIRRDATEAKTGLSQLNEQIIEYEALLIDIPAQDA